MSDRVPFLSRALAVFVASVASLAACVPEFADDQAVVATPRLLAVRSVPAEAKAGAAVELEALVAGPVPADVQPARLEWALCIARRPLTELGPVAQDCIDDFGKGGDIFVRLGRGARVSGALPADACRRFGPLSAEADETGVSGRPVDPDLSGGYYQPVVVGSEVGTALGAVRLACGITGVPSAEVIRYNQGYRPNENPAIDSLELSANGITAPVTPGVEQPGGSVRAGARVNLRAVWAACPRQPVCGDGLCTTGENQSNCAADCRTNPRGCTGSETYLSVEAESRSILERREGMTLSWYATSGTFAAENTGRTETDADGIDATNTWTAPPEAGVVHVWLVLRDDRGGVGWSEYLVRVEP